MARAPLERPVQGGAALEGAGVAVEAVPFARRVADGLVDAQVLAVFVDPGGEPRPLAQQRLVGELDDARR